MSDSSSHTDETPPLPFAAFDPTHPEDADESSTEEPESAPKSESSSRTEIKGSLHRIVTRLDGHRPPKWAMNWRPIGEEDDTAETPGDHHPARIAATEAPMSHESPNQPEISDSSEESEMPRQSPTLTNESPRTDEAEPVNKTSRTWVPSSASADRPGGRPVENPHPSPPRADATGRVVEPPTGSPGVNERSGRTGWMVATAVVVAWLVADFWPESDPPQGPAGASLPAIPTEILARPAVMDPDPELLLLREEISILQDERASMNAELDAAGILMVDHQRLTNETSRSPRRWRTALEQLEFLDEALESATLERARMAAELALVQRMLDEARGND